MIAFLQALGDCILLGVARLPSHSVGGSFFSSPSPTFIAYSLVRLFNLTGEICFLIDRLFGFLSGLRDTEHFVLSVVLCVLFCP